MSKARSIMISMSREAYRNQYAHIEELDQDYTDEEQRLHRSRVLASAPKPGVFQNPYLFANNEEPLENGGSSAAKVQAKELNDNQTRTVPPFSVKKKETYSNRDIQKIVRSLHRHIWTNRNEIWGDQVPKNPVDMLDPEVSSNLLGFSYQEKSGIGIHQTNSGDAEVAGLIDDKEKAIYVSHQLTSKPRRFTAAHEIGHAALHDFQGAMHRDRPDDFQRPRQDQKEREADIFAKYFLMPENLVTSRFLEIFQIHPFKITSETAFALGFRNANELSRKCPTRRDLSRLLASTERFNFEHFESLANQFRVSTEAMAIRLEELGST